MQINWLNIWVGGSAVLLIGSEAIVVAGMGAWAVSGLIGLTPYFSAALIVAAFVPALAGTIAFARMVHGVEPFYGPIEEDDFESLLFPETPHVDRP